MSGVTQLSAHTFEIGGMGGLPPASVSVEVGAPVVQTVTAPSFVGAATAAASAPREHAFRSDKPPTLRQQLAQMKARLREVKRELATKKALEREEAQLQRLIRAANQEIDNVRRLRSAV